MFKRLFLAAAAALFVFTTGAASAQTPAAAQPAGAGPGYRLPTADGKCAVWMSSDQPAPGNEDVSWSGACKNGWAEGFGIQELEVEGELRQQFVGHFRQGRWQGMGRLHLHDEDGLIAIHEGRFIDDRMEGVFKQLLFTGHPENEAFVAYIRKERVGREVGDTYLQVLQFFKAGDVVFLCASPYDCDDQIREIGHSLPQPDLTDPLSATLPYGGWRATITSDNTSADGKTVAAKPVSMGMCMEQGKVKPGREARHNALLFPQLEAWQPYLRADYYCEDDHVEIKGLALEWRSTCYAPDDSETVSIGQKRQITDKALTSETRVQVNKGGKRTAQAVRRSNMKFVGACTDDMVRAGSLNF
jgi:hypothetical protein